MRFPLFSTQKILIYSSNPSSLAKQPMCQPSPPPARTPYNFHSHSAGHMCGPTVLLQRLPHLLTSPSRAGKQLLTCELLEGGVGFQAEPLAVLIEGLQSQLSRFLDDFHSHMQYVVVHVPTPTDLPGGKHTCGLRARPHCLGEALQVRSPFCARTKSTAQPSSHGAGHPVLVCLCPAPSGTLSETQLPHL